VYLVNEGGANPLAKAKDEMTSLHAAAQGGHTSILKVDTNMLCGMRITCEGV
jgi:hypothetical protein